MPSFVSLLPEGLTVRQMLAKVSFQYSLLKEVPDIESSAVEQANHLLGILRVGLRNSALFDPEVLPSLCSLAGLFYCLGEGDWENRGGYTQGYLAEYLSQCYSQLERDKTFGSLVLKLKSSSKTDLGSKQALAVSLEVLLSDLTTETEIGDRVRGLVFFVLGFLVSANINCESQGMLAFASLFQRP